MELNIAEMREKAAEQEAERKKEARKQLGADRERENKEQEKLQALLCKVGERVAADRMAAFEEQVDIAMKNAKAKTEEEHKQKYGFIEHDKEAILLKKMLGNMLA